MGMLRLFAERFRLTEHRLCGCDQKEKDLFGWDGCACWGSGHQASAWDLGRSERAGAAAGGF